MDNQSFLLLATRKLSGEASEQDVEALSVYLNDESYKQKFELLRGHWEHKHKLKVIPETALDVVLSRIQLQEAQEQSRTEIKNSTSDEKRGVIKLLLKFSKIAAIFFLFAGSIYFIYPKPEPKAAVVAKNIDWETKEISKGAKSSMTLPDGTTVILNADSKIKFPKSFSGATREIYLSGEAFFDVSHDSTKPFIIHTDKMNIKVLGTQFNVRSYPLDSSYETTLIHGSVEVTLNDRPADRIILKPREKLIVSNSRQGKAAASEISLPVHSELLVTNLHYISKTDSNVVETSWVDNKLVFLDESFANLAMDMERRYDVDIRFSNDVVRKYRFTGVFEKETIKEALDALKMIEKFNYKIEGTSVHIF